MKERSGRGGRGCGPGMMAQALGARMERRFGRGESTGRRRPFDNGDLRLGLLAMIARAPSHGYELIKLIEDRLGGGYSPSPGVIYPTLTLLEEMGLVTATPDGAKKLYTITEAGTAHLAEQADAVTRIEQRMASFGAAASAGRAEPLTRAVENLRLALRLRTSRGGLSPEQIAAIAAVLDRSATEIERI